MNWKKIALVTAWICGLSALFYELLKKYLHNYFWFFLIITAGSLIISLFAEIMIYFSKRKIKRNIKN
jgi:hypothetical protein